MKRIFLLFISFLFFSNCSPDNSSKETLTDPKFNKEHNEQVTKIHSPEGYKFNTEVYIDFIRISIIDLDKKNCAKFNKDNKFEPINDTLPQTLIGMNYLDSVYRQLPDNNKLVRISGKAKWTKWIYLLDTTTCRLYCHFSFPDYNGYTK
jgi:hypothetical protein